MKRIKFLVPFMAFVLAIGGAFATSKPTISIANNSQLWYFVGAPGEENDRTKYQASPVEGRTCGEGDEVICSIMDEPFTNGIHPELGQGSVTPSNTAYLPELRVNE